MRPLPNAAPEDLGFDPTRLRRIDEHLTERYVKPGKIAGALCVVGRRGQIAHASPLGSMDLERGKTMQEDTIFRIYSMTKPITSIALMQLFERGAFQLDDPVHRFIPDWRELRVYETGNHPRFLTRAVERPMQVRDLLTHMSGLTYGFMERTNVDAAYRKLEIGERENGATLEQMIEKLAGLPLEFSPGTAWNYSVSTDVLGHLVQVISGQRFDDYLRDHITGPLGMVDTGFHVPDSEQSRFAANYARTRSKRMILEDDPERSRYCRPATFLSGGGGLVSTAADYARFCQMLVAGGSLDGATILSRKTLELMTRNHLPDGCDLTEWSVGAFSETAYDGVGFGLGFASVLDPVKAGSNGSIGEFFWGGAASTVFWIDPVEELFVVFLTQLMPSGTFNFRGQLRQIVYGALR